MARLLPQKKAVERRIAADRLFKALDGCELLVEGSAFRVEVFGVFDEPDVPYRRWVQISIDGSDRATLTLRLDPMDEPTDAVRELSSWLADPTASDNVLQHVA